MVLYAKDGTERLKHCISFKEKGIDAKDFKLQSLLLTIKGKLCVEKQVRSYSARHCKRNNGNTSFACSCLYY